MTLGQKIAWDDSVLPFQLDASDIRGRVARQWSKQQARQAQHQQRPLFLQLKFLDKRVLFHDTL